MTQGGTDKLVCKPVCRLLGRLHNKVVAVVVVVVVVVVVQYKVFHKKAPFFLFFIIQLNGDKFTEIFSICN